MKGTDGEQVDYTRGAIKLKKNSEIRGQYAQRNVIEPKRRQERHSADRKKRAEKVWGFKGGPKGDFWYCARRRDNVPTGGASEKKMEGVNRLTEGGN